VPDEEVHQTAADLESGRDPVVDAAAHWIGAAGQNGNATK
jgi:hypothetical protein